MFEYDSTRSIGFVDNGSSAVFCSRRDVSIPLEIDYGEQRGGNWFEAIRVERDIPIRLEDHIDRFFESAIDLELPAEWSREYILEKARSVAKKNYSLFPRGMLKIFGSAGTKDGFSISGPSHLQIIEYRLEAPSPALYVAGVHLGLHPYHRPNPRAKSPAGGYENARRFRKQKASIEQKEYDEVLHFRLDPVTGRRLVYEGSSSNFFCVVENVVVTPPEGTVLAGVTRKAIIKILRAAGAKVEEREIALDEIQRHTKAAWISSTSRRIMPVRLIEDYPLDVRHQVLLYIMNVLQKDEEEYCERAKS